MPPGATAPLTLTLLPASTSSLTSFSVTFDAFAAVAVGPVDPASGAPVTAAASAIPFDAARAANGSSASAAIRLRLIRKRCTSNAPVLSVLPTGLADGLASAGRRHPASPAIPLGADDRPVRPTFLGPPPFAREDEGSADSFPFGRGS